MPRPYTTEAGTARSQQNGQGQESGQGEGGPKRLRGTLLGCGVLLRIPDPRTSRQLGDERDKDSGYVRRQVTAGRAGRPPVEGKAGADHIDRTDIVQGEQCSGEAYCRTSGRRPIRKGKTASRVSHGAEARTH